MLTSFLLINCTKLFDQDYLSLQNKIEYIKIAGKDDPLETLKDLCKLISEENIKLKYVYESLLCTNQSDIDTQIQKDNEIIKDIMYYIFYTNVGFKDLHLEMKKLYSDIEHSLSSVKSVYYDQIVKDFEDVRKDIDKWEEDWKSI